MTFWLPVAIDSRDSLPLEDLACLAQSCLNRRRALKVPRGPTGCNDSTLLSDDSPAMDISIHKLSSG